MATSEAPPVAVTVVAELFRRLLAGLRGHQVFGVPVRPVFIVLSAGPLLVFAVGRRCARRAAASSATEANVVCSGSTRPGNRVVTSCNSQVLPSGSLNVAYEK